MDTLQKELQFIRALGLKAAESTLPYRVTEQFNGLWSFSIGNYHSFMNRWGTTELVYMSDYSALAKTPREAYRIVCRKLRSPNLWTPFDVEAYNKKCRGQ